MRDTLSAFFRGDYIPNETCSLWHPGLLWTQPTLDVVIVVSYFLLPIAITYVLIKKPIEHFRWFFLLCAAFIMSCGITHLANIATLWHDVYPIQGMTKLITVLASFGCIIVFFRDTKRALASATTGQEHPQSATLDAQKKADAIFKFAIELLPTGLMVINNSQRIIVANQSLAGMFGYEIQELVGAPLSLLLNEDHLRHHEILVDNFMATPSPLHTMASGRIVRGKRKNGGDVAVEISLSSHEFEGEKLAFASVACIDAIVSERSLALEISNRIKRAVDATNDGLWEWNVQTNVVWFSARTLHMLGHDPDTPPQFEHWLETIHPDDRDLIQQKLQAHFNKHEKFDVIYRCRTSGGSYEWVHTRADTIFDSNNNPLLMSGIHTNINEIKALQERLAEQTYFLDEILHKSLCGNYIFDLTGFGNVFVNAQYTEITGYTLEDLTQIQKNNGLLPLFHRDDQEAIAKHLDDVIQSSDPHGVAVEYRLKHKQGHWIWCYSRDSIYSRDENGNPTKMLGSFFDISDLKQREMEIKQLAKDFETTFEQAAVGLAHVSLDGEWIKANQRLCDILRVTPKELNILNLDAVTLSTDRDIDANQRLELLSGRRRQYSTEKRFLRLESEHFWVNLTISMVLDEAGHNSHLIVVVEDISDRKRVAQALTESNAQLERFAYSASHDLQEPLRKISAFSDSLERRLVGKLEDPDARYELNRICNAASRMREMIDSLLQLSRYTRHKIDRETVLVSSLIALAKDDLSKIIEERHAEITAEGNAELFVDINGLQQVLRNLITNGIRYAKPDVPPVIHITANRVGDTSRIAVSDNGQGFNNSYAEQIFEPFKRLVGRETPGSGMGLALCRQIIAAHSGSITAKSTFGEGSTFTIELPCGADE